MFFRHFLSKIALYFRQGVKQKYLQKIFSAVPKMVGKKIKYSQVDDSIRSRNLKEAVELLAVEVKAGKTGLTFFFNQSTIKT